MNDDRLLTSVLETTSSSFRLAPPPHLVVSARLYRDPANLEPALYQFTHLLVKMAAQIGTFDTMAAIFQFIPPRTVCLYALDFFHRFI